MSTTKKELGCEAVAAGVVGFASADVKADAAEAIANILHYVKSLGEDPAAVILLAQLQYGNDLLTAKAQAEDVVNDWTEWRKPDHPSSQVIESRYNQAERIMAVRFKSGDVYHYANVPPTIFDCMNKDASAGSFLHKVVKANAEQYPATKQ